MELLGLAAFIDDALLGNEEAFRRQYASGELTEDRAADLKARLAPVVVRTLRRQVKEYVKFTARRSIVEDFAPTAEEQELYDRVSEYLRREDAQAIPQARRALFVLVYRGRSSPPRPSRSPATLDRLADTLEQKIAGVECSAQADLLLEMDGFADEVEELFDDGRERAPRPGRAAPDERRSWRSSARARGSPARSR